MDPKIRLARAIEGRRRSIGEYGWALRVKKAPSVIAALERLCRETDAELTAATAPFVKVR
jgi:hypothetical protein